MGPVRTPTHLGTQGEGLPEQPSREEIRDIIVNLEPGVILRDCVRIIEGQLQNVLGTQEQQLSTLLTHSVAHNC